MDLITSLKQEYSHLDPLIIIAAERRSGATQLQQLVNAGGEAIIYGENPYLCHTMPRDIRHNLRHFDTKCAVTTEAMTEFLQGDRTRHTDYLYPHYELYSERVLRPFYELLDFYRQQSIQHGLHEWGLQIRIQHLPNIIDFFTLLPGCRIITAQRDVLPLAHAHYKEWPERFADSDAFRAFGYRWAERTAFLQQLQVPRIDIPYDDLQNNEAIQLQRIELFTTVTCSADELLHRAQRFEDTAQNDHLSHTEYTAKSQLPEQAFKALLMGAGEYYYEAAQALTKQTEANDEHEPA